MEHSPPASQVWFPWRGIIRHAGGDIVCRCGFRGVGLFAMQAERLCARVVSVAWDYSPCRRRDCVQVWFPWRGIIRHAGGEIVCTCGARVYGICPLKSTICITYCPASCYVYYYPVFMSRVDMIIATILPFV